MSIIKRGVCGTCVWELDDKMTLTIRPQDGKSGVLQTKNSSSWPWRTCCHIKRVVIEDGVKTGTYTSKMFAGMRDCTEFDVSELDVSAAENMRGMFEDCCLLEDITALKKWDVSKTVNVSYMFVGCGSLKNISALSGWDTSQVVDIHHIFYDCGSLTDISALAGWDTSQVINMSGMFENCYSLTDISSLKKWNISNVVNTYRMFRGCASLTDISALTEWNTSKVRDMSGMFRSCCLLEDVSSLKKWDVSNVKDVRCMFCGCTSLTDISPLSGWNLSNVRDAAEMFRYTGISYNALDAFIPTACPREGAFIGYKKCWGGRIVQLEVPEDARRSSAYGRKCRCDRARVLNLWTKYGDETGCALSCFDNSFVYWKGETVEVSDFDNNRFNECSSGIHLFMSREEAESYMP